MGTPNRCKEVCYISCNATPDRTTPGRAADRPSCPCSQTPTVPIEMIAKRLLVGIVALGIGAFVMVASEGIQPVRAQQQPPFTVPHGGYSAGSELCAICHDWHPTPNPDLFSPAYTDDPLPPDTPITYPWEGLLVREYQTGVCYQCHDGSASSTDIENDLGADTRVSSHPVLERRDDVQLLCSDCHAEHQDPAQDVKLLYRETTPGTYVFSPPSSPIGDTFCYGCHGSASTLPAPFGDKGLFETSIHATSPEVRPPTPGTGLKCSACHEPHASDFPYLTLASEEDLCFTCHTSAAPNTANGSNPEDAFSAATNDYIDDANGIRIYHHPIAGSEQDGGARTVECASCHNSHLVNRTETAADPAHARRMDSGWRFDWDVDSGLYNRSPNAAAFCGSCHVDPGTTQPLVADGTDVPYDVNVVQDGHDLFALADYASSAHGVTTQVGPGYLACPPGQPCDLACTACHDFHGSTNAFMLRESIVSPDYGPSTVLEATATGDGIVNATATLRIGPHAIGIGFVVDVSGVIPAEYDGTFTVTSAGPNTISYVLPTSVVPADGLGGSVDPGGVGSGRPYTATVTGYGATDTASDLSKIRTFCLTCHLEVDTSTHDGQPDQACTDCHDHSSGL